MSVAATWKALVGTPRVTTDYTYTGNVLTGGRAVVWVPMIAQNGRRVADTMTAQAAREYAAQLIERADEADELNRDL